MMNATARNLTLASMLMAFVEMMLIRWTGSNIFSLHFYTNFVLIASFLGIGIGFLRVNNGKRYFRWSPFLLFAVVLFSYIYAYEYHAKINPSSGTLDYSAQLFSNHLYPVYLTLPLLFIAVTLTMAFIADAVAYEFKQLPSLQAYRFEIMGTISGIVGFALLSYLKTPPLIWGLAITAMYAVLMWRSWRSSFSLMTILQVSALLLTLTVFYLETTAKNHTWSTYYKIQVKEFADNRYVVNVNGLAQQIIDSVEQRRKLKHFYFDPYDHRVNKQNLDNVLVIGAGTGGDVAIALAQGAKHVDAVEIDPELYETGKRLHPNQPYSDPRVTVHINDGRAFLEQTQQKYDLIIYALTDSLMLITGQSSLRLENYLYTIEGLTAASKLLKKDGVFTVYNLYMLRWFVNRLANTLQTVYQTAPCLDTYGIQLVRATAITTSFNPQVLSCPKRWTSSMEAYEKPATDNHPFIYLQYPTLTPLYVLFLLIVGLVAFLMVKATGTSTGAIQHYFDLFLMGAAFLLMETKSIVSYALLFGSTWMVNTLVFVGILFSVYIAIELTRFTRAFNRYALYAMLCAALLIAWLIPASSLLSLSPVLRLLAATALTFSPIFIANLIFAGRMGEAAASTDAMGANLLGAVFGGLLEYSSLLFGYQNMILLILAMYSLAFFWLVRRSLSMRESYA